MNRRSRWLLALSLSSVLVVGGVVIGSATLLTRESAVPTPFGLRLGMGPRDARARLAETLPGELRVVPSEELALEWHGVSPDVRSLRLELHDGKLVALRARVAGTTELANGDRLWQSRVAVLSRRALRDGDVDVTLIARDCPTHRDEVRRLLGRPHAPSPSR